MLKLLNAYKADRTMKRAQAIRAYDRKHPMSRCMFGNVDQNWIADAIHHANSGKRVDEPRV
jgi:hypothetical protein